jgi:hypothetical protein
LGALKAGMATSCSDRLEKSDEGNCGKMSETLRKWKKWAISTHVVKVNNINLID